MNLDFTIDSKGGGRTQIQTRIHSKDFSEIVEQMMKSDSNEALRVMSAAIAEHHS